jgi:hypothetical protein
LSWWIFGQLAVVACWLFPDIIKAKQFFALQYIAQDFEHVKVTDEILKYDEAWPLWHTYCGKIWSPSHELCGLSILQSLILLFTHGE